MTAVVAHCLRIGAIFAAMLSRTVAVAMRRAGAGRSASASRATLGRQQLFDPAVQLRGQPSEHVSQIRLKLVRVELSRLQQAHHHRSPLVRQLASDEEPIAPPQGPRPKAEFGSRHGACFGERDRRFRERDRFERSVLSCVEWIVGSGCLKVVERLRG